MRRAALQQWLERRVHISWLLACFSAGCVVGLAGAAVLPVSGDTAAYYLAAAALGAVALNRRTRLALVLILCAGLLAGFARGMSYGVAIEAYEAYRGLKVTLRGVVAEDTTFANQDEQRIRLESITINDQRFAGTVWVSTSATLAIKRSDQLTLRGQLSDGFGTIAASMFRATIVEVTRADFADPAREFRDWFAEKVRLAVPEPAASLGIGYLVGQRSALPDDLNDTLQLLGLTHIVVASGYNLTILVRFTRGSLARYSKYVAFCSALLLISGFVLITGFSPSMSRAALIAVLSLGAWYVGRNLHPLVLLPVAAGITGMLQPSFVWGDIGWYLSFTAFAGVMLLAPLLASYFFGGAERLHPIMRITLETIAAQLATAPIILYVFAQYSILSVPANILIVPLVPLAMLLIFLAGMNALFLPALAAIGGLPAAALLGYMVWLPEQLASLPWASSQVSLGLVGCCAAYGVLLVGGIYMWRKTRHNFRSDNLVV